MAIRNVAQQCALLFSHSIGQRNNNFPPDTLSMFHHGGQSHKQADNVTLCFLLVLSSHTNVKYRILFLQSSGKFHSQ